MVLTFAVRYHGEGLLSTIFLSGLAPELLTAFDEDPEPQQWALLRHGDIELGQLEVLPPHHQGRQRPLRARPLQYVPRPLLRLTRFCHLRWTSV